MMMRSHVGLPKIVQGIHDAEEDSPSPQAKDEKRYKEGDYGREGEVSA